LTGTEAISQTAKALLWVTSKIEVQSIWAWFLGNVGDSINPKKVDGIDFDAKFLRHFPAERGLNHIIAGTFIPWGPRVTW
jgi:hypothetical protein